MAVTVLVVDDSLMARMLAKSLLSELRPSWHVETAADGDEALVRAQSLNRLDGVLLDINMPGKDGMEVAKLLRAHFAALPIFFCSANVQEPLRVSAAAKGCGFVQKPVNRTELNAFLEAVG